MKTPFLSLLLGAATLIHADGRAAEESPPYDDIVKKYDRNGDGLLDEEEKVAAKEAMAMQAREERPAAAKAAAADPEQRARMLQNLRERLEKSPLQMRRFDRNRNGRLDDSEWETARAQFERREKAAAQNAAAAKKLQAKGAEVRDKALQEFDKDGDGRLDEGEREAMAAVNRARAEANPRILARFDRNRDGKLDDAEWEAARARVGEIFGGRQLK